MADMTKVKAAVALGLCDHEILGRETARELVTGMGLDDRGIPFYALEHRPDEVKGAVLAGCTKIGEKRMGIGADELAEWCCRALELEYRHKFGRGSRLRECVSKLIAHFKAELDPTEAPE